MRRRNVIKMLLLKRRITSDISGLAALEFAMIAPLLMLMLVGVVEISRAISMNRKFSMVTATVADLVSREENMTAAAVGTINQIVTQIMMPYDAADLNFAIIPVRADPANASNVRVYACLANRPTFNGANEFALDEPYEVPANMLPAGATMIVVEAHYQFVPLMMGSFIQPIEWSDKAYLNPRKSCVDFDNTNCVTATDCPDG